MKKHFLIGLLAFSLLSFSTTDNFVLTGNVYICKGSSSKKYHLKKNCRGLSNCSTPTYEVPLSQAKKLGRTLCGWED